MTGRLHLAVALDGAGWHPAAWRVPGAEPHRLLDPRRWVEDVRTAEDGLLDLVTIEDSLGLQDTGFGDPDGRTDLVRGRLDALLVASRVAPLTRSIGLVPTVTTTHTEPFHVAKAVQTLDHLSLGRAGWRVQVSPRSAEAAHFGRRELPTLRPDRLDDLDARRLVAELFDEAADAVEVSRRLWDSWEDDAIVRDAATGRFVDRDRLHHVDFAGARFSVRGPSIVPRSPQGQPVVVALGHATVPYRLGALAADVLLVTPHDDTSAEAVLAEVRGHEQEVRTLPDPLRVLADLVVVLDDSDAAARSRLAHLDDLAGAPLASDARVVAGSASTVADLLEHWASLGYQGYRLRPATVPHDLRQVVQALVPELQRRGLFRTRYEAGSLRGLLGLPRPASRYAA